MAPQSSHTHACQQDSDSAIALPKDPNDPMLVNWTKPAQNPVIPNVRFPKCACFERRINQNLWFQKKTFTAHTKLISHFLNSILIFHFFNSIFQVSVGFVSLLSSNKFHRNLNGDGVALSVTLSNGVCANTSSITRFWAAVQSFCGSRWVTSQNGFH